MKNSCPKCDGLKDTRAILCKKCQFIHNHPRKGTGAVRTLMRNGYFSIQVDCKAVLEHRHIMEIYIGRKLSSKEHVHHINGIRTDNRIENLELMSASDHHKSHMTHEIAKQLSVLGHAKRWGDKNSYL